MAEHTITLSESTYQSLIAAAQSKGISPDDWIASKLNTSTEIPKPSSTFPSDLVGAFNSKDQSLQSRPVDENDAFGQYVVEKMAKQGIHLP
ncbi:MAG: hypothetical protein WA885_21375 [Phormidesmis sp.]